jgi:hypothetical protein
MRSRRCLVNPAIAAIWVDWREAFLNESTDAGREGCIGDSGASRSSDTIVFRPGPGQQHTHAGTRDVRCEVYDNVLAGQGPLKRGRVEKIHRNGTRADCLQTRRVFR